MLTYKIRELADEMFSVRDVSKIILSCSVLSHLQLLSWRDFLTAAYECNLFQQRILASVKLTISCFSDHISECFHPFDSNVNYIFSIVLQCSSGLTPRLTSYISRVAAATEENHSHAAASHSSIYSGVRGNMQTLRFVASRPLPPRRQICITLWIKCWFVIALLQQKQAWVWLHLLLPMCSKRWQDDTSRTIFKSSQHTHTLCQTKAHLQFWLPLLSEDCEPHDFLFVLLSEPCLIYTDSQQWLRDSTT